MPSSDGKYYKTVGVKRSNQLKNKNWPFDQPENCACITLKSIVEGTETIQYITHDIEDHCWQFLTLGEFSEKDASVVSLKEMVDIDKSILKVADMKPGYCAIRKSQRAKWKILKMD